MTAARQRGNRQTAPTVYVLVWAVAALCALIVLSILQPPLDPDLLGLGAALAAATAAGELIWLRFELGRDTHASFTFRDAPVVASIVLLPPLEAVAAIAIGVTAAHVIRGLAPIKVVFNTAISIVASMAAIGVVAVLPTFGPEVEGLAVIALLLGMTLYAAVDLLGLAFLMERVADQRPIEMLRDHGVVSTGVVVGNAAVGLVLAYLWYDSPGLIPLLIAPLAAMHLSYRGAIRSRELLNQLRTEHERLDRVVIGTSDGILLLDGEGVVELWNDALVEMTGISASTAVGRPVGEVLTPTVRHGEGTITGRWHMEHCRPTDPVRVDEAMLLQTGGTSRFVRESHTFLFDARGRCMGDVVLIHDITRERELDAMKGDFIARVSHELRTPLTPIRGFAEVLARRGDDLTSEQRTEAAASIASRAARMTALVEDLLLVARLDSDEPGITVDPVIIDLSEIAARTIDEIRVEHPNRRIDYFDAPGVDMGLADPDRTRQILTNLLDNALRYSPVDSPVEVAIDQDGDDVTITITDHGPGIPRDKQQAIFERFHRLEDPLRMRTSGVGLGLFIAQGLAEAMHGGIEVDSQLGEGAKFILRLPAAKPAVSDSELALP